MEVHDDVDDLYKIFSSELLGSDRAECKMDKGKSLVFNINAKDPVAMKAILNSLLKIIETYKKTKVLLK